MAQATRSHWFHHNFFFSGGAIQDLSMVRRLIIAIIVIKFFFATINYFSKGCKLGVQMAGVKLMLDHISGLH